MLEFFYRPHPKQIITGINEMNIILIKKIHIARTKDREKWRGNVTEDRSGACRDEAKLLRQLLLK